jgi:hypothetical protein
MERANWTCEWCLDEVASEQHEVARGIHRARARTCLFAVLASGFKCHRILDRMPSDDAVMIGLALIQIRRPEDYSLSSYWRLTGRNWPDQADVDRWRLRLSLTETRR